MTFEKRCIAMCLAALLTLPVAAVADDHGQRSGSDGGNVSDDSHGDNHGQNGNDDTSGNQGEDNQNPPGPGVQNGGINNANPQPQRVRVALAATVAGTTIGAEGHADLRAQGNEQRLTVEIEANVPDGTMFTLTANSIPIGTITIHLGEGEFEFESQNGEMLAGSLAPAAITSIALADSSNTVVLQAQFGAITNNNPGLPPVLAVRKQVQLTPTSLGTTVNAEGNADLRSGGADTGLKIEVEGNVPDGTLWTIFANGNVKLGTVTFQLMEAELHLETAALVQAGLNDASSIASIQVNDAGGKQVLSGTF